MIHPLLPFLVLKHRLRLQDPMDNKAIHVNTVKFPLFNFITVFKQQDTRRKLAFISPAQNSLS